MYNEREQMIRHLDTLELRPSHSYQEAIERDEKRGTLNAKTREVLEAYGRDGAELLGVAETLGVVHGGSWMVAARGIAGVLLSCDDGI